MTTSANQLGSETQMRKSFRKEEFAEEEGENRVRRRRSSKKDLKRGKKEKKNFFLDMRARRSG